MEKYINTLVLDGLNICKLKQYFKKDGCFVYVIETLKNGSGCYGQSLTEPCFIIPLYERISDKEYKELERLWNLSYVEYVEYDEED